MVDKRKHVKLSTQQKLEILDKLDKETTSQTIGRTLKNAIDILQKQHKLHQESALLSRLICKWKRVLKKEKGFQALEKVNRSLLQYLALDMVSILETANKLVYDTFGPSRQIIEWVLVRLQGFSKLFDNIYHRCVDAASYLQWRFQNGHMLTVAFLAISIVSRICVISVYLLKECCVWYSELKQMLPTLQPSIKPWLPAGYEFPEDIAAWLDYPDYIIKPDTIKSSTFEFCEKHFSRGDTNGIEEKKIDFLTSLNKLKTNEEIDLFGHLPEDTNNTGGLNVKTIDDIFSNTIKTHEECGELIARDEDHNEAASQEKNKIKIKRRREDDDDETKSVNTVKSKKRKLTSSDSSLNDLGSVNSMKKVTSLMNPLKSKKKKQTSLANSLKSKKKQQTSSGNSLNDLDSVNSMKKVTSLMNSLKSKKKKQTYLGNSVNSTKKLIFLMNSLKSKKKKQTSLDNSLKSKKKKQTSLDNSLNDLNSVNTVKSKKKKQTSLDNSLKTKKKKTSLNNSLNDLDSVNTVKNKKKKQTSLDNSLKSKKKKKTSLDNSLKKNEENANVFK